MHCRAKFLYNNAIKGEMKKGAVSFNVKLLAGTTHMRDESPQAVFRPAGMDGWILNCGIEGAGLIRGGPEPFVLRPGQIALFPPETPHLYGHLPEAGLWTHHWIYFFPRESWLEWMRWPSKPPGVLHVELEAEAHSQVERLFEEAVELSASGHPRRSDLTMNKVEEILIRCDCAKPEAKDGAPDPRVEAALRRMEGSPAARHSLESLAKGVSLSPSRFSHLFKEGFGRSPMESLEELRVRKAKELIFISSKSLQEIAEDCGFKNQFYFSRVFKKLAGMPPGEFRERLRGGGPEKAVTSSRPRA